LLSEEVEVYANKLVDWAESRERFAITGEGKSLDTLGEICEKLMTKCGERDKERLLEVARKYGFGG
jgi:hypothetical protein